MESSTNLYALKSLLVHDKYIGSSLFIGLPIREVVLFTLQGGLTGKFHVNHSMRSTQKHFEAVHLEVGETAGAGSLGGGEAFWGWSLRDEISGDELT